MRRLLAPVCCAAYLAFGLLAGLAHLHGSAGHHEDVRGPHSDHAHAARLASQLADSHGSVSRIDARHCDHDACDAVYLSHTAIRSLVSSIFAPAVIPDARTIERPRGTTTAWVTRTSRPRDPPPSAPTRLRSPPA